MTHPILVAIPLASLLMTSANAVLADPSAIPLTYEQFEASVVHVDLDSCPSDLAADDLFCRATFLHDEIHVFAFSQDGESPMVGFASFPAEGLDQLIR